MRISIAAIGRMKSGPERELVARYLDRAIASGKPLALTGFDVTEINESRAGSAAARKAEEAKALRAALPDGVTVMLDERGKAVDSERFAARIGRWRDDGRAAIGFVIGLPGALIYMATGFGAEGLPPFSLGYVNLFCAAVIIPLSTSFARVGVKLAHSIPRRSLRLAFGLFLLLTSARMFSDLFGF